MTNEEAIEYLEDAKIKFKIPKAAVTARKTNEALDIAIKALEQEPNTGHYEKHIDHTDCIWYGNDSGCPVTCSQYRDGWNDAMEYIFKGGKGYQPYRREE